MDLISSNFEKWYSQVFKSFNCNCRSPTTTQKRKKQAKAKNGSWLALRDHAAVRVQYNTVSSDTVVSQEHEELTLRLN